MKNYGNRIKQLRLSRNLSQFQLELGAEIAHGSISRIESGITNPTKETLLKISKALNLDTDEDLGLYGLDRNRDFFGKINIWGENFLTSEDRNIQYSKGFGKDVFVEACDSTLNHQGEEIIFVLNLEKWRKIYSDDYGKSFYIPKRIAQKSFAKIILNPSTQSYDFKKLDNSSYRKSKIDSSFISEESFAIVKDKVIVFYSNDTAETLIVKDQVIANKVKEAFNCRWNLLQL